MKNIGNELDMEIEVAAAQTTEAPAEVTSDAPATEETTSTKRDPLAKYNELSKEKQETVDEIVADVIGKIGGEGNIELAMLLGILDKLNAEKKSAREVEKQKEKERKEELKQKAVVQKAIAANIVKENDHLDYYFSSKKVRVLDVKVTKVTAASARIDVNKDTRVLYKGKEMKAGDLPASAGFVLGTKSAPLGKIENLTRNGVAISLDTPATEEAAA
jgi:hypothetical protein